MLIPAWKAVACPVIGMLHVQPLPGSPRGALSPAAIRDFVLRDADSLTSAGIHGLLLENFGDIPFTPGRVTAATVAQLTWLAGEVRRGFPEIPLGINVLRNDGQSALAIAAAVGGGFVRVNVLAGSRLTDQGIVAGIAHDLLRDRRQLGAEHIRILADVDVKHSVPLAPQSLADEATDLVHRALADALIVTGRATGRAASGDDVRQVKAAVACPVLVGSGVDLQSAPALRTLADGVIVGSSLKLDGQVANPVDPSRVRALLAALAGEKP